MKAGAAALAQTRMKFLPPARETLVVKSIFDALRFTRCLVWRNNTGAMRVGSPLVGQGEREREGKVARKGRYVTFGLGTGSADIVGMTSKGRFFALEVKTETGTLTPEQKQWNRDVTEKGGYVAMVRSAQAALRALAQAEAGLPSPPVGVEP
jgi:hypothetical protein